MANPFDRFDAPAGNPFDRFDRKAPKKKGVAEDTAKSFGSGLVRGVVGAGEMAELLFNPGARIGRTITGAPTPQQEAEKIGGGYQPQGLLGKYAQAVGEFAPGALMPGGLLARAANVIFPAVASETAGQGAQALGAGPKTEAAARFAGALVGGGVAGIRANARTPQAIEASAARKTQAQAPQDAARMAGRAQERRALNVPVTGIDVLDEAGLGVVRAASSRMTPARTAVQEFAGARANDLPNRMSGQARAHLSADPRTPQAIANDLGAARGQQAAQEFGAVRGDLVPVTPEARSALGTELGLRAIREAAMRERDPQARQFLLDLPNLLASNPNANATVGAMDRISRVLNSSGQSAARAGDNDLAATYSTLGGDIRDAARSVSPGYGQALDNFGAESRIMAAAERGEDFLARNTDDFVADIAALGPQGLPVARATARRAVERASGENVSAAPGVARRIATAPEQQARTRAILPEDAAQAFERSMALEAENVGNAQFVAPRTGSPTQGRQQDVSEMAGDMADDAVNVMQAGSKPIKAWQSAMRLLSGQGLNRREAEALSLMAIDPNRADEFMALLQNRVGPNRAAQLARTLGVATPALLTTGAAPTEDPGYRY